MNPKYFLLICCQVWGLGMVSQTVETIEQYSTVSISGPEWICQGESITLTTTNIKFLYQNVYRESECYPNECIVEAVLDPQFQGPSINSHNHTNPDWDWCHEGNNGTWSVQMQATPNETSLYTIEWTRVFTQHNCNIDHTLITIVHYSGQKTVNVVDPPTPILVEGEHGNNSVEIQIENCNPLYDYRVRNLCDQSIEYVNYLCSSPFGLYGQNERKTIDVRFRWGNSWDEEDGCLSDWSNPITVDILPAPGSNTCLSNPSIQSINQILSDPTIQDHPAYHNYVVETSISTIQEASMTEVYNFMKSDIRYQIPTSDGIFPLGETDLASDHDNYLSDEINMPGEVAVVNCDKIGIGSIKSNFLTAPAIIQNVFVNEHSPNYFKMCDNLFRVDADPVIVLVDNTRKCVTNYTLPGHIFYPGKVERCIMRECDTIFVRTVGEGIHFCDTPPFAQLFAFVNEYFGERIFEAVDEIMVSEIED